MARLNIVYHPVSGNLPRHISESVLPELKRGKKIDFLLPSVHYLTGLKETLIRNADTVLPGQMHFGTYFTWANQMLDADHQAFGIIGHGEEWLLLYLLLKKKRHLFHKIQPGSLSLILKIVTELRESGKSIDQLNAIAKVASDIAPYVECLNAFINIATKRRLASSPTLLMLLAEYLQSDRYYPTGDRLIVAGFYEFSPVQQQILNSLIGRYPETTLYFPENTGHPALQYLKPVSEIIGNRDYCSTTVSQVKPESISDIIDQLFVQHYQNNSNKPDIEPSKFCIDWQNISLKLLRCPNRRQEVDAAARTVKKWIYDGIEPRNIAVVFRGCYDYSKLIRLLFPGAGITVAGNGQLLSESTLLRIVQKVFEVNERNFSRDSIIDLTRFAEVRHYYGADVIQKFEYKSAAWGLSFSKGSWLTQLTQRQEFIRTVIAVDDDDSNDISILRRELDDFSVLLPVLRQLLDDISLPSSASWSEYIQIVQNLLKKYGVRNSTDNSVDIIFNIMKNVFRNLSGLVNSDDTVDLRHFNMALKNLTMNLMLPKSDNQQDTGITIGNIIDIQGECFDAVVLLGLVEGEFPLSRRENPLLNSRRRLRINQTADMELLRLSESDIKEEKFLYYNLAARTNRRLLITYPQFDSNGRSLPASSFLDEIRNLFNHATLCKSIRYEAISPALVIPEIGMAISPQEVLFNKLHYHWSDQDQQFFNSILKAPNRSDIGIRIDMERRRKDRIADAWNGRLSYLEHRKNCFQKPLSVTRLQQYAWCPFLYLCQSIWKIESIEEPLAEISPLTDGLLIHALFESFLKNAGPQNFKEWKTFITGDLSVEINAALKFIHQNYRSVFAYVDESVWNKKLTDLKRGLKLLIDREIEVLDTEFYPAEFERRLSFSIPLLTDDGELSVPFKLKIDRIDRRQDNHITIIEYKRSKSSVQDPVRGLSEGIHFQIPFYMLAYRQLHQDIPFAGAYSYIFNEGRITKGIFSKSLYQRMKPVSYSEIDELIKKTHETVVLLLRKIYAGDFFLKPYDIKKRCQHGKCAYYELCRIDTRTVEMMSDTDE
ncbi:MAG: PD-(D/E)XK nuclease family protein [Candidatus Marinimicrobia bacterium]|nr:PD-(D/E)XK nuclease family protein [Candidatus Neomarinimicrobiota bacterium]